MTPTLVGIDVGSQKLDVRLESPKAPQEKLDFSNDPEGHRALIKHLTRRRGQARVVLEASGVYHLDIALALHRTKRTEVMVINPESLGSLPNPPTDKQLFLRTIARRIAGLVKMGTAEKNRLHAAEYLSPVLCHDIKINIRHLRVGPSNHPVWLVCPCSGPDLPAGKSSPPIGPVYARIGRDPPGAQRQGVLRQADR